MSHRGSQTLFSDIFTTTTEAPAARRKGRNDALHGMRNECLVARYYFYGKHAGLRYDLILSILSKEFFLSEVTIPEIINDNYEKLQALKKENPSKNELAKKWPHLQWSPAFGMFE